jgi:hypothetical protein
MFSGGNWSYVGGPNLNNDVDYLNNIALDGSNNPYVVFPDGNYSYKASVMEYNGSAWVYTGLPGFSLGEINFPNIAIDAMNNIYVEYYDSGDSNKVSVMKFASTTSVENINVNNKIVVYPNPASNTITFHESTVSNNRELIISDISGREVYYQSNINNSTQITINTSSWKNGIYFYELKGNNENLRGKLVIQK